MGVKPGPSTGDMKSNSSSSITGVFAASSTSAGKTSFPTLRCLRGWGSQTSSPPFIRHKSAGELWGHVSRMAESWIPKHLFYGELHHHDHGRRKVVRQPKRYKLIKAPKKSTWTTSNINATTGEKWCSLIHKSAIHKEAICINAAKVKRGTRKAQALNATGTDWCQTCESCFHDHIGLIWHMQKHPPPPLSKPAAAMVLVLFNPINDEQQYLIDSSNKCLLSCLW